MIFSLFKRSKPASPPSISEAIARLSDDPSAANRNALYSALKAGQLFLAAQNIPHAWAHGPVTLQQATSISVLTSSAPDGGEALLAFTSRDEALKRNKAIDTFAIASLDALHLVVSEGLSGLILNPAGPWAGVPVADVQSILGERR